MAYASRGDENIVGATVRARAVQLIGIVEKLFSSCSTTFHFVGAATLVELVRKQKQFRLELPFVEHLSPSKESHICSSGSGTTYGLLPMGMGISGATSLIPTFATTWAESRE